MKYRILWNPDAEEILDDILKNCFSAERIKLLQAVRAINFALVNDPYEVSESRSEAIRIAFEFPLGVYFELMEDVWTVIVIDIWRTDRR